MGWEGRWGLFKPLTGSCQISARLMLVLCLWQESHLIVHCKSKFCLISCHFDLNLKYKEWPQQASFFYLAKKKKGKCHVHFFLLIKLGMREREQSKTGGAVTECWMPWARCTESTDCQHPKGRQPGHQFAPEEAGPGPGQQQHLPWRILHKKNWSFLAWSFIPR